MMAFICFHDRAAQSQLKDSESASNRFCLSSTQRCRSTTHWCNWALTEVVPAQHKWSGWWKTRDLQGILLQVMGGQLVKALARHGLPSRPSLASTGQMQGLQQHGLPSKYLKKAASFADLIPPMIWAPWRSLFEDNSGAHKTICMPTEAACDSKDRGQQVQAWIKHALGHHCVTYLRKKHCAYERSCLTIWISCRS